MDLNRRTLLAGMAMGISSTAAYSRTITAQSSEWTETDLITLEGEIEVDERPYLGELNDINDSGEVCGSLVASEQKISPLVWAANGKGKRLKSGEFGGRVLALNNSSIAVGSLFRVVGGFNPITGFGTDPGIWVDGELIEFGPSRS